MIYKLFSILLLVLLITNSTYGQFSHDSIPEKQGQTIKKYKVIYEYTYGLQRINKKKTNCQTTLSASYGFDYKVVAGCCVTKGQLRRWTKHNEKVRKEMEKRFGKDWKEKYQFELAKCIGES